MSQEILERLIGSVIILVVMVAGMTVYWLDQNHKLDGYHLTAQFENIGMLKVGDPVQLGGIKIGHVASVDIDPENYFAKTLLWIQEDVRLWVTSSASIRKTSFAGGHYVKISPGEQNQLLPPRSEIIKTDSAIDITSLLKEVLKLAVMGPNDSVSY